MLTCTHYMLLSSRAHATCWCIVHMHTIHTTLPTTFEHKSPVRGHIHRTALPTRLQHKSPVRGHTHWITLPTRFEHKSLFRGHIHKMTLPTRLEHKSLVRGHTHTQTNKIQYQSVSSCIPTCMYQRLIHCTHIHEITQHLITDTNVKLQNTIKVCRMLH